MRIFFHCLNKEKGLYTSVDFRYVCEITALYKNARGKNK